MVMPWKPNVYAVVAVAAAAEMVCNWVHLAWDMVSEDKDACSLNSEELTGELNLVAPLEGPGSK